MPGSFLIRERHSGFWKRISFLDLEQSILGSNLFGELPLLPLLGSTSLFYLVPESYRRAFGFWLPNLHHEDSQLGFKVQSQSEVCPHLLEKSLWWNI